MPKTPRLLPSEIAKREAAVRSMEFRLSADVEVVDLKKALRQVAAEWVFQKEKGEETDYEHFQGHLKLLKRQRSAFVRDVFLEKHGIRLNYCQPTCSALVRDHPSKIARYVTKSATRLAGPWSNDEETEIVVTSNYEGGITWKPWQRQILDDIQADTRDPRTVNVVLQKEGNVGKSFLLNYIDITKKGIMLPPTMNSSHDVMRLAFCFMKSTKQEENDDGLLQPKDPKAFVIDLPRGICASKLGEVYTAIEILKNGYAYDDRYEGKRLHFEQPKVWVMTNIQPNKKILGLMSRDRWRFWQIGEGQQLVNITSRVLAEEIVEDYVEPPPAAEGLNVSDWLTEFNI